MKKILPILLISIFLSVSGGFCVADTQKSAQAPAQTPALDPLGQQCSDVAGSDTGCSNMSSSDCRALLLKCADYYDKQSAQLAQDLTKTAAQKSTLKTAITKLKNKISGLEADIKQGNIMVKDLNIQISDTEVSINKTTKDINDSQEQIVSILRAVNKEDQKPAVFILLEGNLSDFFSNLTNLQGLNAKISDLLDTTKNLKIYLQDQQGKMNDNVDELQKTIAMQTLQKKQNEQAKTQQNEYLKLTEAQYQQQLKDKTDAETRAAKLKAMLFQVAGVSKAPTFGEAMDVAKSVSNIVPIRPAFLLAVISQESALGKNVGQCLLTNKDTSEGKRISSGAYMKRIFKISRDLKPFLNITASLGRDPLNTPVSCDSFGSMGPAQFLPSTWMLFADRLKTVLGVTADPWGIKDSFTASAMYLSDLGASGKTAEKEKNAAYHYNGSGSAARIYSRSVMNRANCIQTFIDAGTMTPDCQNLIF